MKINAHILLLALSFVGLMNGLDGENSEEWQSIQGTWVPTKAEMGGVAMTPETLKMITLKLADGKYEVQAEVLDKGAYKIDQAPKIHTLDIVGTDGPNAGKTILAIYEFDGTTLRVCYNLGKGPRPAEFKSPGESLIFLATYKRASSTAAAAAGK